MNNQVRCKFRCVSEKKRLESYNNGRTLWDYEFQAVTSGSEENKQFFAYTPYGKFEVSAVNSGLFEIGKEYFFDISKSAE